MDLTPEQMQQVAKAIEDGVPRMRALKAGGINEASYRTLLRFASEGVPPYPSFLRTIERAESEAQKHHVQTISNSADWRAHAFILERQYPKEWGQKIQFEVKRELEKVFAIAEEILPEEQFIRLLERVSRADSASTSDESQEVRSMH